MGEKHSMTIITISYKTILAILYEIVHVNNMLYQCLHETEDHQMSEGHNMTKMQSWTRMPQIGNKDLQYCCDKTKSKWIFYSIFPILSHFSESLRESLRPNTFSRKHKNLKTHHTTWSKQEPSDLEKTVWVLSPIYQKPSTGFQLQGFIPYFIKRKKLSPTAQ